MISPQTITVHHSIFLLVIAGVLLKSPETIYENPLVIVLGALVRQTYPSDAGNFAPFVAALLAFIALQDISTLLVDNPIQAIHSSSQWRLLGAFVLSGLGYSGKLGMDYSVVFAFGFLELVVNFWIYLSAREQVNEQGRVRIREARGLEEHE